MKREWRNGEEEERRGNKTSGKGEKGEIKLGIEKERMEMEIWKVGKNENEELEIGEKSGNR